MTRKLEAAKVGGLHAHLTAAGSPGSVQRVERLRTQGFALRIRWCASIRQLGAHCVVLRSPAYFEHVTPLTPLARGALTVLVPPAGDVVQVNFAYDACDIRPGVKAMHVHLKLVNRILIGKQKAQSEKDFMPIAMYLCYGEEHSELKQVGRLDAPAAFRVHKVHSSEVH
jgi:hypothetical protein